MELLKTEKKDAIIRAIEFLKTNEVLESKLVGEHNGSGAIQEAIEGKQSVYFQIDDKIMVELLENKFDVRYFDESIPTEPDEKYSGFKGMKQDGEKVLDFELDDLLKGKFEKGNFQINGVKLKYTPPVTHFLDVITEEITRPGEPRENCKHVGISALQMGIAKMKESIEEKIALKQEIKNVEAELNKTKANERETNHGKTIENELEEK